MRGEFVQVAEGRWVRVDKVRDFRYKTLPPVHPRYDEVYGYLQATDSGTGRDTPAMLLAASRRTTSHRPLPPGGRRLNTSTGRGFGT